MELATKRKIDNNNINEIANNGTYRNGTGFVHYDHVVILVDDFYCMGFHGSLMPDQIILDR